MHYIKLGCGFPQVVTSSFPSSPTGFIDWCWQSALKFFQISFKMWKWYKLLQNASELKMKRKWFENFNLINWLAGCFCDILACRYQEICIKKHKNAFLVMHNFFGREKPDIFPTNLFLSPGNISVSSLSSCAVSVAAHSKISSSEPTAQTLSDHISYFTSLATENIPATTPLDSLWELNPSFAFSRRDNAHSISTPNTQLLTTSFNGSVP